MCRWNCERFAEALDPLLPLDKSMAVIDDVFKDTFERRFYGRLRLKLGLLPLSQLEGLYYEDAAAKVKDRTDRSVDGMSPHFFDFHFDAARGVHLADSLGPVSEDQRELIDSFFTTMAKTSADFTNAFRGE